MFDNKAKTPLNELKKSDLDAHLIKNFTEKKFHNSPEHIGQSAAIVDDNLAVFNTCMIENVHFDLMYTPLKHLGFKAVTAAISGVCGKLATPKYLTLNYAVSSKYTLEALEELFLGIKIAAEQYQLDVIQCKSQSSKVGLIINMSCVGSALPSKNGQIKAGDLLCVTGDLGGAYAGLQVLEREKRVFLEQPEMQPDMSTKDYILERQLRPQARLDFLQIVKDLDLYILETETLQESMGYHLFLMCKQHKVGVKIYEEKIPIDPMTYDTALEFNLDPTLFAINGGEDYEMLFAISQKEYEKIKNSMDISIIGYFTPENEGKQLVTKSGNLHDLEVQGF
jgi:thiamine-monophosphate kinase